MLAQGQAIHCQIHKESVLRQRQSSIQSQAWEWAALLIRNSTSRRMKTHSIEKGGRWQTLSCLISNESGLIPGSLGPPTKPIRNWLKPFWQWADRPISFVLTEHTLKAGWAWGACPGREKARQGNEPAFSINQLFLKADDDAVVDGSSEDWKAPRITGATSHQPTERRDPRSDLWCRWLRRQKEETQTHHRMIVFCYAEHHP